MSSFSISVGLTVLALAAVAGTRWYRYSRGKGFGAVQYIVEWPGLITLLFLVFTFGTLWLFYLRDGIEGAKAAWNFGGPIIGLITGYWFGRPQQE